MSFRADTHREGFESCEDLYDLFRHGDYDTYSLAVCTPDERLREACAEPWPYLAGSMIVVEVPAALAAAIQRDNWAKSDKLPAGLIVPPPPPEDRYLVTAGQQLHQALEICRKEYSDDFAVFVRDPVGGELHGANLYVSEVGRVIQIRLPFAVIRSIKIKTPK